jgi:hypothetical protein
VAASSAASLKNRFVLADVTMPLVVEHRDRHEQVGEQCGQMATIVDILVFQPRLAAGELDRGIRPFVD